MLFVTLFFVNPTNKQLRICEFVKNYLTYSKIGYF